MSIDLARMRLDYETAGLSESDVAADPLIQFDRWMQTAVDAGIEEANAMVLATVDADGQPWCRYVLLKGSGPHGFDFYTNFESNKSTHLAANPKASLTFGWLALHRQVNIAGTVERVPDEESDGYWLVRPRAAQLGAWASAQSSELTNRQQLLDRYADAEATHPDGTDVPRPPHWGGWRLVPHTIEFWQGRQNRLHDRLRYRRLPSADGTDDRTARWNLIRLSP